FVDGQRINLPSETRTILTPALEPGRDYYYIVRAQAAREGKVVEDARRVIVRAGHSSRVEFALPTATVKSEPASRPAQITVRLPDDAKLYVDGVARTTSGGRRTFDTPNLEPGKSYYYVFKAEVVRDGQVRSEDQRVVVEAGKQVTVDFLRDPANVATAQR